MSEFTQGDAFYRPFNLLCIDDQESSLKIRKLFLETLGHKVLTASSGSEGLELLQNNLVEAVILDYHMPEMDGLEVARAVRQIRPQLPIILLSGYPSKLPRELVDLIDGFVAKGAAPNLLREMLEEILGSRSVMRHPVSSEVLKESAVHSKRVVSDNVGRQKRRRLKGGR